MRQLWYALYCLCMLIGLAGCGQTKTTISNRQTTESAVNQLVKEKTKSKEDVTTQTGTEDTTDKEVTDDTQAETTQQESTTQSDSEQINSTEVIDYDFTNMSSDMVYATVFQMMVQPEDYLGKIFRMKGQYYVSKDQTTGVCYHCCLIKDALACCAQGLEFVWEDGSHIYPDEYPEDGTEIIIQGKFETYQEDNAVFCRLANATMEIQ